MHFNRRISLLHDDSHIGTAPPDTTPTVVRFKLFRYAHMNLTLIDFKFLTHKNYDFNGNQTVWQKETRSG